LSNALLLGVYVKTDVYVTGVSHVNVAVTTAANLIWRLPYSARTYFIPHVLLHK